MQPITKLLGVLFFSSASICHAMEATKQSPYDYRIKSAIYNPLDTVQIDAVIGLTTHIIVSPTEKYITHAFGDPDAWMLAHTDNHYFIKPKDALSDTNLTIVTDQHVYHLLLHFIGEGSGKAHHFIATPWAMRQATIELAYQYPEQEKAKALVLAGQEKEQQKVQQELKNSDFDYNRKNFDYIMSNDPKSKSIQPISVWDDYRFTYFKFTQNSELPTVFVISSDGKESAVNVSVTGKDHNIIIAHMVAPEWRIRYGKKRVIGIVNHGFNPALGSNQTGTTSPLVERYIKTDGDRHDNR